MKVYVELWLVELFCGIVLRCGVADFELFTGSRWMLDCFVQWKGCLGFLLYGVDKEAEQLVTSQERICRMKLICYCMDVNESRRLACIKKILR